MLRIKETCGTGTELRGTHTFETQHTYYHTHFIQNTHFITHTHRHTLSQTCRSVFMCAHALFWFLAALPWRLGRGESQPASPNTNTHLWEITLVHTHTQAHNTYIPAHTNTHAQ